VVQKQLIFIVLLMYISLGVKAQEERSFIREGNANFNEADYLMADSMFLKALAINPESIEAQYNLANSKYNQQDYVGAITDYENLIPQLKAKHQKAKAYHNLGNAYLKNQRAEEAIEAFKNALRNNPADEDSRYNLAYAKRMMNKNKQNKSDQKNDQKNDKNQQNKDNKNSQNSKDNKNPNEDQKKEKNDKKGDNSNNNGDKNEQEEGKKEENGQTKDAKEDQQDGKPEEKEGRDQKERSEKKGQEKGDQQVQEPKKIKAISKAQAQQLLKELENNESAVREKMIRSQMEKKPRKKIEKDW
tara:strand:+ start:26767 stop:27669 length:903 start_codon:yes stop_codon:yes gene_type:complete